MKFLNFFSIFVGHICPPGSGSGSCRPKSMRIRNTANAATADVPPHLGWIRIRIQPTKINADPRGSCSETLLHVPPWPGRGRWSWEGRRWSWWSRCSRRPSRRTGGTASASPGSPPPYRPSSSPPAQHSTGFKVLWIPDVYPGSRIRIFHPGSRIRIFSIPDPGSKNKSIFSTQKIFSKLSKNMIRVVHSGSGSRFRISIFYPTRIGSGSGSIRIRSFWQKNLYQHSMQFLTWNCSSSLWITVWPHGQINYLP